MLHNIILYLLFGTSYSFGMYQLNKFLNEINPYLDLKSYNWIELILLALLWPFFLFVFIVSFFKS
jgi:hypothetical protein